MDDERRVGCDLRGGRMRRGECSSGVVEDVAHEADLLGACGVDVLAGQREFTHVSVADDQGKASEATDVATIPTLTSRTLNWASALA